MAQANKNTFRLSLALGRAILLFVCILLLPPGSEQADGPTMCGQYYHLWKLGHKRRGLDWTHHAPRIGTSTPAPHAQTGIQDGGLRLRTPYPPYVIGQQTRPICGEIWKDDDVVATVWGGLSQWKHVGWLTRPDQRNCGALIQVQAHRTHGENAPVVQMRVRDGGALGIPPVDWPRGCQVLGLSPGAFRALGVSKDEETWVRYYWDFVVLPK